MVQPKEQGNHIAHQWEREEWKLIFLIISVVRIVQSGKENGRLALPL